MIVASKETCDDSHIKRDADSIIPVACVSRSTSSLLALRYPSTKVDSITQ